MFNANTILILLLIILTRPASPAKSGQHFRCWPNRAAAARRPPHYIRGPQLIHDDYRALLLALLMKKHRV